MAEKRKPYCDIDRMFERDERGNILRSKGVWSSYSDACIDCKRTDRKHEAKGRCAACDKRWRRANDPEYRARRNQLQKESNIRHWEKIEARDKARAQTPERKAQRRIISRRYMEKKSKWPIGGTVWFELTKGNWISGEIITKTNSSALVKFKTFTMKIPFAKLSREKPFQVMEGEV